MRDTKFQLLNRRSVTATRIKASMIAIFGAEIDLDKLLEASAGDMEAFAEAYKKVKKISDAADKALDTYEHEYNACNMVLFYENCRMMISFFDTLHKSSPKVWTAAKFLTRCKEIGLFQDMLVGVNASRHHNPCQIMTMCRLMTTEYRKSDAYIFGYAGLSIKTVITMAALSPERRKELLMKPVCIHNQWGGWTVAFTESDLSVSRQLTGTMTVTVNRLETKDARLRGFREWMGNAPQLAGKHFNGIYAMIDETKRTHPADIAKLDAIKSRLERFQVQLIGSVKGAVSALRDFAKYQKGDTNEEDKN